jgi:polysaccharide deacetylase family protein (PEP-CTERM system associated)
MSGFHALTVDVEDWFHICGAAAPLDRHNWDSLPSRVERTTDDLLHLFDRASVTATFFVLGWVAERHPDLIVRIRQAGHEIGTHGWGHDRVYSLTADEFAADVDRSITAIDATGAPRPVMYRAPEWSINDRSLWALDVLAAGGFTIDSSMAPLQIVGSLAYRQDVHARATKSGRLTECPPAVRRRLAWNVPFGGGWGLRMMRPRAVLRELDARRRRGAPAVFWIHPWEIDPEPPRARLSAGQKFAHYFALAGFRDRLSQILLAGGSDIFGPLSAVAARVVPRTDPHAS